MNSPTDNFNLKIEEYKSYSEKINCIFVVLEHKTLPIKFADKIEFRNEFESEEKRNTVVKNLFSNFILAMKHSKAQTIINMTSFTGDDTSLYVPEFDWEQNKWFILKNDEKVYE